jgi:hypothetical protein
MKKGQWKCQSCGKTMLIKSRKAHLEGCQKHDIIQDPFRVQGRVDILQSTQIRCWCKKVLLRKNFKKHLLKYQCEENNFINEDDTVEQFEIKEKWAKMATKNQNKVMCNYCHKRIDLSEMNKKHYKKCKIYQLYLNPDSKRAIFEAHFEKKRQRIHKIVNGWMSADGKFKSKKQIKAEQLRDELKRKEEAARKEKEEEEKKKREEEEKEKNRLRMLEIQMKTEKLLRNTPTTDTMSESDFKSYLSECFSNHRFQRFPEKPPRKEPKGFVFLDESYTWIEAFNKNLN